VILIFAVTSWIRFIKEGVESFGTLEGSLIKVHSGDMLENTLSRG
jgi:hypothetical protein